MAEDDAEALLTLAEQSEFRETGRSDEVERLSRRFAERRPDAVRSFENGRSAERRPLRALMVTRCGALSAGTLRARGDPGRHPPRRERRQGRRIHGLACAVGSRGTFLPAP